VIYSQRKGTGHRPIIEDASRDTTGSACSQSVE
jgi:hypothetical protein